MTRSAEGFLLLLFAWAVVAMLAGCATEPTSPPTHSVDDELRKYEDYVRANPEDMAGWVGLAQRYINYAGDREAARQLPDRLLRAVPHRPEAWLACAQILQMAGGSPSRTREFVERYIELEPRNRNGYLLLMDLERDDPAAALDAANRGINLFRSLLARDDPEDAPDEADELERRGHALSLVVLSAARAQYERLLGRHADALVTVTDILDDETLPDVANTWELTDLAVRLGCHEAFAPLESGGEVHAPVFDSARARLDTALVDNPSLVTLIQTWAWMHCLAGREGDAISGLTGMLRNTENPDARLAIYNNLANAEVLRGNAEIARRHARRALEIKPDSTPTLLLLYQVMLVLDDANGANATAERLAQLRVSNFRMPRLLTALQPMLRGVMARRFDLFDLADRYFREAHEIEPDASWPLLALAQSAQAREEWAAAIQWYRPVLVEPELAPEVHCSIGDCYLAMGDYKNAIRHYRDALALTPTNPRATRGIQRAEELRDS